MYTRWRRIARQRSLAQCLEAILDDTHYDARVLALPDGGQRQANIRKLLAWARQFDQLHRRGLFHFLELLKAHDEAEIDHEPATVEAADAVRIMTVHQSKGLEFPVVIASDLGKKFNLQSLRDDLLLDEIYGLCGRVKPPFTGQSYPSLPSWLASRRIRRETLGEELRILYVALTRACQMLLLTGTATRKQIEEKWATTSQSTRDILKAGSFLDWIGPWLPQATGTPSWHQHSEGDGPLIQWKLHTDAELKEASASINQSSNVEPPALAQLDDTKLQNLMHRLSWRYPHEPATSEPAKASVSDLRRRQTREDADEAHHVFRDQRKTVSSNRPGKLSAAELGTLHHTFLQLIALRHANDLTSLGLEAAKLVETGVFTLDEIGCLNLESIAAFWNSQVGQSILKHSEAVHREVPFTVRFDTGELFKLLPGHGPLPLAPDVARKDRNGQSAPRPEGFLSIDGEFIVVQGVIDLAVILPEEIWLLDFKTDAVGAAELESKTDEYRPQLTLYALALERIYRRPVTRRWLHFLRALHTVDCTSG